MEFEESSLSSCIVVDRSRESTRYALTPDVHSNLVDKSVVEHTPGRGLDSLSGREKVTADT